MASGLQGAFVNYYELLGIAENASITTIQTALETYRQSQEMRLNNQLSMTAARTAINEIIPAIERTLLHETKRAEYDQQIADFKRKQTEHYEPEDDEGLDDPLRIPFLFNPFDDFDTEIPAFTLRSIAMKLDNEWDSAHRWITDTTDETHGFISYLTFVANRTRLAERIGHIIESVSPVNEERMDTNEGIERCINILDPRVERPRAGIHNFSFDGRTLDAGSFITDLPASFELILGHDGVRGCAFGVLESLTSWLSFDNGQASKHFALIPMGTEATIGPSEIKIPLHFAVGNLVRNTDHTARLLLRMENQINTVEQLIQVQVHMQPLPPRVVFTPDATERIPVPLGVVRRGVPVHATVTPQNFGDEALVPFIARITTQDDAASARPYEVHTGDPITLTIDTSNRPYGQQYTVAFDIEYVTPEAKGPTSIYAQGEILPTSWQSIVRTKSVEERLGTGCLSGLAGLIAVGFSAWELSLHSGVTWLFFLGLPALFLLLTRGIASTTIVHMQRAGNTALSLEKLPFWLLWGIPVIVGLVLSFLCTFLPDVVAVMFISGSIGFLAAGTSGFLLDKAKKSEIA